MHARRCGTQAEHASRLGLRTDDAHLSRFCAVRGAKWECPLWSPNWRCFLLRDSLELMKLPLTDAMRRNVLQARERQMEELTSGRLCAVDRLFASNEVVRLHAGMGRGAYVGTDGRVTVWNYGEGQEPAEVDYPKGVASIIVRWAKNVDLEELVTLLPSKPSDGLSCYCCNGNRFTSLRVLFDDASDEQILCPKCHGLGWIAGESENV